MSKVIAKCSGVIVGSDYDDDFFDTYIENGTITPASRFIFSVAQATDELEVHINSYGGDVFAANSMIIALKQWASTHPDAKLTYVVESICMSAAANILAKAPKNAVVMAFEESIIMFHSATTFTWGGPGAHKDSAQLLEMINNSTMAALFDKTTLNKALVQQWFQDERMGWLNGHDCLACGLVNQICMEGAPELAPDKYNEKDAPAEVAAYFKSQRNLLALFNHTTQKGEMTMPKAESQEDDEILKNGTQQEGGEGEGEEKKDDAQQEGGEGEGEEKKDDAQQEGGEGEGEKKKDDAQQLANVKAENEALKKQVEDLKKELAAQQEAVKKLTAGFRRNGGSQTGAPAQSFKELVASIDPNLPQAEWDKRYLQLKKENPSLYQQYFESKNNPKH